MLFSKLVKVCLLAALCATPFVSFSTSAQAQVIKESTASKKKYAKLRKEFDRKKRLKKNGKPLKAALTGPVYFNIFGTNGQAIAPLLSQSQVKTSQTICVAANASRMVFHIAGKLINRQRPHCVAGGSASNYLPLSAIGVTPGLYYMTVDFFSARGAFLGYQVVRVLVVASNSQPPVVPPTATPTPTATQTNTPVPQTNVPKAQIFSLNSRNLNGDVVGQAPFTVYTRGIQDMSSISKYQECQMIEMPIGPGGGYYIPLGHPKRADWERLGDARRACFEDVAQQVVNASRNDLKRGDLMTATYSWNFGDSTPSSRYNELDGWSASHVYEQPGDYTITHRVTNEDGATSVITQRVIVLAADRREIYVSKGGNDANSGSRPDQSIRSLFRLRELTRESGNYSVFFRAGDTFEVGDIDGTIVVEGNNIRISRYGAGAAPLLKWVRTVASGGDAIISVRRSASDVSVDNLAFDTDVAALFAPGYIGKGLPTAVSTVGSRVTVRDCLLHNVENAVMINGVRTCTSSCWDSPTAGTHVMGNRVPSPYTMRSYFVWNGVAYMTGVFGNVVENSTVEHIVRAAAQYQLLNAQDNSFRNTSVAANDFRKGSFTIQGGSLAFIKNNSVLEGSISVAPLGGDVSMRGERAFFAKIDGNVLVTRYTNVPRTAGGGVGLSIGGGASRVFISNNTFQMGNASLTSAYDTAIEVNGCEVEPNRCSEDITIAHNSFAAARGASNRLFVLLQEGYSNLRLLNNLMIFPDMDAGYHSQGPVKINQPVASVALNGVTDLGCNTYPMASFFRGLPFNVDQHGINYIGSFAQQTWLTIAEWQARLANYRVGTKADKFQRIPATNSGLDVIPELAFAQDISCPAVKGVSHDAYGTARGSTVTAGAYQFPQ